jgi:hypothetical protein
LLLTRQFCGVEKSIRDEENGYNTATAATATAIATAIAAAEGHVSANIKKKSQNVIEDKQFYQLASC